MLSEKFYDVLKNEGVVSIVTCANNEAHVVNTWNSFLTVTEDGRILIPAYGFRKTQKNIEQNNTITISLGSKNVIGYKDYQGTGFIVKGSVKFLENGTDFDTVKEKFDFANRVMEITVESSKQMI